MSGRRPYPILMYHWFRAGGPSASRSPQLEITPGLFERQMALLSRQGYRTIPLSEAVEGTAGPDRTVTLTFDDGTLDFWEHARPVLDRHGFKATLFVVTGHVGGTSSWDQALGEPARPLMSWEQLLALHQAGHEIGSHTHGHRPLVDLGPDEARGELVRSRDLLAERLGTAPSFVAYPRGFYHPEHKRLAREAGYAGACAVLLRWRDLLHSDRYELKRMTIKSTESLLRFRLRVRLAGSVRYAALRA